MLVIVKKDNILLDVIMPDNNSNNSGISVGIGHSKVSFDKRDFNIKLVSNKKGLIIAKTFLKNPSIQ